MIKLGLFQVHVMFPSTSKNQLSKIKLFVVRTLGKLEII